MGNCRSLPLILFFFYFDQTLWRGNQSSAVWETTRQRLTFNEELLQSWLQRQESGRIQKAPPSPWNHLFKYAEAFVLQGLGLNNLNFAWGQEQDFERLLTPARPKKKKVRLNNKCLINGSVVLYQIPQHKHKIYIWGVTRGNRRRVKRWKCMHPYKMYKS